MLRGSFPGRYEAFRLVYVLFTVYLLFLTVFAATDETLTLWCM